MWCIPERKADQHRTAKKRMYGRALMRMCRLGGMNNLNQPKDDADWVKSTQVHRTLDTMRVTMIML